MPEQCWMLMSDLLARDGLRFGPLGENWTHICVDMQRMFAEPTDWQTPWMNRVMPQVVRLVEVSPDRTVFTRFVPPLTADQMTGAWWRYYVRWHRMTRSELDPGLVQLTRDLVRFTPPARVVDKTVYSPWHGTSLQMGLSRLKIDTLIVSGAETEVCVLATVLGAIDRGYRTIIATDAICSSADATHDAMLTIYHGRFGMQVETATVDEIIDAIR
jgi:nicotinamidase-related amidase